MFGRATLTQCSNCYRRVFPLELGFSQTPWRHSTVAANITPRGTNSHVNSSNIPTNLRHVQTHSYTLSFAKRGLLSRSACLRTVGAASVTGSAMRSLPRQSNPIGVSLHPGTDLSPRADRRVAHRSHSRGVRGHRVRLRVAPSLRMVAYSGEVIDQSGR